MIDYSNIKNNIMGMSRNIWLAGLGTVSFITRETQDAFTRVIEIKNNINVDKQMVKVIAGPVEKAKNISFDIMRSFSVALENMSFPLTGKVQALTTRVENMLK